MRHTCMRIDEARLLRTGRLHVTPVGNLYGPYPDRFEPVNRMAVSHRPAVFLRTLEHGLLMHHFIFEFFEAAIMYGPKQCG